MIFESKLSKKPINVEVTEQTSQVPGHGEITISIKNGNKLLGTYTMAISTDVYNKMCLMNRTYSECETWKFNKFGCLNCNFYTENRQSNLTESENNG